MEFLTLVKKEKVFQLNASMVSEDKREAMDL
jgi:hypothetical protein